MHIEITTRIGCLNNCSYCPQDKLVQAYLNLKTDKKELSVSDFKLILSHLPPNTIVHFSGMVEPFLNRNCSKFINLCSLNNYPTRLYTTLVGATDNDISSIMSITKVGISILEEEHSDWIIKNIDQWTYILDKTRTHPHISYNFVGNNEASSVVKRILAERKINLRYNQVLSRAGNIELKIEHNRKVRCKRETQPVVLPNGDVALCCMDYSLQHIIGNIFIDSLETILSSTKYQDIINNITVPLLCKTCEFGI